MDIFKTLLIQNPPNLALEGQVSYQGTWDASANSPALTSSVGTKGYYYVVSTSGSTNLNGVTTWTVGDWAIFNGAVWQKVDNTDAITSINGTTNQIVASSSTGDVTLSLPTTIANVNSITGSSAASLTLNGGSSGSSLVLGQGVNGTFSATAAGTTPFSITGVSGSTTMLAIKRPNNNPGANARISAQLYDANNSYVEYASIEPTVQDNTAGAYSASLRFGTAISGTVAERMRISTSGNLLVGTTNDSANAKLNVAGNNNAALRIDQGGLNYYAATQHVFTNPAFATEYARFVANGNLLLGTTTDSSNGKLQLATHTTSAGGIGFGTDTSLYRSATGAGALELNAASGVNALFSFALAGTKKSQIGISSSNSYFDYDGSLIFRAGIGGTTTLTLDSSQNATFAGNVIASRATGSATITPATIQIRTTTNAGDWSTTSNWGNLDFWSEDTSGPGNTTRARIGARAFGATGAQTSLYFSTSDAAGGLLDRMVIGHNGDVTMLNTTASTSTSTGALIVSGGVGVAGALYTGGNIVSSGTGNNTFAGGLAVGTGYGFSTTGWLLYQSGIYLYLRDTVNGAMAMRLDPGTSPSVTITNSLAVSGTTASSSTTTGALVVSGGAGIAGSLYAGGQFIDLNNSNNGQTAITVTNSNAGTGAYTKIGTWNGTVGANLVTWGSSYTGRTNETWLYTNGAYPLKLGTDSTIWLTIAPTTGLATFAGNLTVGSSQQVQVRKVGAGIGATATANIDIQDTNDSSIRLWRSASEFVQLAAARGGFTSNNNVFLFDVVGPNFSQTRALSFRSSIDGGTSYKTSLQLLPFNNNVDPNVGVSKWLSNAINDTSTVASGTNPRLVANQFEASPLTATNASVTTTDAATVYITGGPTASTNQTITNSYGLWNVGKTRLDNTVLVGTGTNSSNGIIQLATHTTSAGGIGFGTDVSIYRNFASQISTNAGALTGGVGIGYFSIIASGTSPLIFNNGDGEAFRVTSGRGVNIGGTGAVSAGNLNVAGDATFGGVVKAPAGSSTSPSHTFSGDTSSGIYSLGTKKLGIAVNANIAVAVQADVDGSTGPTVYVKDLATAPTVNPSGGGYLFSQNGALKWRGSSGTVTTIAAA